MCGICGFISKEPLNDAVERIQKMNHSLVHRGPDAGGFWISCEGRFVLGHRRLSIIDTEDRSNQPMTGSKGSLVYNGEVYNYRELKSECSYPFQTDSDTEVLLAGLEERGIDWLQSCNGMFAFAYYDWQSHELLLARDRLGIKPLYYYFDGSTFVFASEIKGILASGLVKTEFNEEAVDEYLGNRYVRAPYTFFKNIFQLQAGCYLTVTSDLKVSEKRYWTLPQEFNFQTQYNNDYIYSAFKDQVISAIKRRLVADVPLGTYLSGGVDSSLISAIAAMNMKEGVDTYTIGFPELNEFEYARMVSERYGTRHHEILIRAEDYLEKMQEIIGFKDAPLGVPNEVPLAVMSKTLKKDITVVLSGEGADELMGGYGRIFRSPFTYQNTADSIPEFYDYFISQYEYVPRAIRDKYIRLRKPLRERFDELVRSEFRAHRNEENVFRYFHDFHVKGLLQRVDTTTMYASVEARVPFLDHELLEFCYRNVPYDLKLRWRSSNDRDLARNLSASKFSEVLDTPKYLLRKMGMEYLPEEVITRKKVGFPVPLNLWMSELRTMAETLLKDAYWLNCERLEDLIVDCKNNERSGQILWMFINVELFRRMYFE